MFMTRFDLTLASALMVIGLTSCVVTPPAVVVPPPVASCNANNASAAIGKVAVSVVVEQARMDAGARVVRVIRPGEAVTMEYMQDRLNIEVNANNVIITVRCG